MESPEIDRGERDHSAFTELFRATAAPLADDGFTARVLAALPAPVARPAYERFDRRFLAWTLVGASLGAAVAAAKGVTFGIRELAERSGPVLLGGLEALFDPWVLFALTLTVICAIFTRLVLRNRNLFV